MRNQILIVVVVFLLNTVIRADPMKLSYNASVQTLYIEACSKPETDTEHTDQLNNGNYTVENGEGHENAVQIQIKDGNCKFPHIPRTFFEQLNKLVMVFFTGAKMESIEAEDFGKNVDLQRLTLDHNLISQLPPNLCLFTPQINWIDLSENNISLVDPNIFGDCAKNLKHLDLSHNQIEALDVNLFRNAINLEHVDLSYNRLKRFEPNMTRLNSLQNLKLPSNQIDAIYCNIYPASSTNEVNIDLQYNQLIMINTNCSINLIGMAVKLDLSYNLLESLEFASSASSNLVNSLKSVVASNNKISKIITQNLYELTFLDLDNNRLTDEGVSDLFKYYGCNCGSLEYLSLSGNEITKLNVVSLIGMKKLQSLNLGRNKIQHIPFGLFSYAEDLEILDISYNNLREFHFGMFLPQHEKLRGLYLNDNKIKTLHGWDDSILPGLGKFAISNNSLECDYLSEFMEKTHNNFSFIQEREDVFYYTKKPNINAVTCIEI